MRFTGWNNSIEPELCIQGNIPMHRVIAAYVAFGLIPYTLLPIVHSKCAA